jgi:pimeloyl-ACP methyl ester carboxylesterase
VAADGLAAFFIFNRRFFAIIAAWKPIQNRPEPPSGFSGGCGLVFCCQRKLLFVPPVRDAQQVSQLARQAGLERWKNSRGENVGMKRLAATQPAAASVLICYGNASSATGCAHYADVLQALAPLDVFILEYPGYEDRAGPPTRETLLHAAADALPLLATNRPVFLVGESLGTGVASWLAGNFPGKISGLMLLSPYERLADVAQFQYPWLPARWLMRDDLWSGKFLQSFRGPVGVMVDGRDRIVPARFGRRLFENFAGPKRLWEFSDSGHVQVGEPLEKFWREVIAFWQLNPN